MLKLLFRISFIFTILLFLGCSKYQSPINTEPYSLIKYADDEKHIAGLSFMRHISIGVYEINDKKIISFFELEKLKIKPGKTKLLVVENNLKLPRIYKGELNFLAKAGEQYLLTSEHLVNNGIFDVVFMIIDSNGNIVTHD